MGIQRFQQRFAGQMLPSHCRAMGSAGTAGGLHQGLLDNAVFNIQRELAAALLRGAPANTMGKAADIPNLLDLDPVSLLRQLGRAVALGTGHFFHAFHFVCDFHACDTSIRSLCLAFISPPVGGTITE